MISHQTISKTAIQKILKPMPADSHKGQQGHALLIGGSFGKIGSVCLSSKAALKSGCGLVTAFLPKCGYEIIQTYIPEVMAITDENHEIITNVHYNFMPNAIGIGVGIGQDEITQHAFYNFLKNNTVQLIVDADALNILSKDTSWLSLLPSKAILTPHKKELERLIGTWQNEEEKLQKVIELSTENSIIIIIKGAPTVIVDGENSYKNTTGNQALATAGSGDVLTGIITGLVAQNYQPIEAAILGVYLHGLTADIALPEKGFHSFIASDCIDYLPKAFLSLL
ncbi:NAD(P)H-hydrate dehydratase [Flavobacterium sp.]|uniref:NAD(P)H-hydrate dehydratase n=1 Tax=Flavobacterium sp. TaxID=239 RepID=UPI002B4B36CF|nr:NAD(P)H-hydrate dehydratase [Flavobacterium sp.]HLP65139.1 NAD(P)H-hydrate dehydratase [Flavobacterium sp.]